MDLRDCIREAMCDLPDTEKMIVLSVMIDTLMDRVSELRKEVRFIRSIPISKIDPYQNHPFYVADDEDMMNLARSIKKYGVLTPCIVRIKEDIVYYSPSYPGFKKNIEGIKQFYYGDEAKDYGVAHLALAYVYAGRPSDMATWGGTHASACGDVWTRAKALADALYDSNADFDEAVPESFKIFICYMDGVQDMVVGYLEAPGYLTMKKLSNRTSITDGNNCYSLDGAEYTVYDKNGSVAGRLYTDASGNSNTIELMEGKYTVKETYAPPGYAKDTETYTVNSYCYDRHTKDERKEILEKALQG